MSQSTAKRTPKSPIDLLVKKHSVISNLSHHTAIGMLKAQRSVWGGRISFRIDKKTGTHVGTFVQGNTRTVGVGTSPDGALVALAHAVQAMDSEKDDLNA